MGAKILYSEQSSQYIIGLVKFLELYGGLQQPPSCQESEGACDDHMRQCDIFRADFKEYLVRLSAHLLGEEIMFLRAD